MGHPIHKHMSSGQRYDDKQAYNKDLSDSARLHYLENEEHDKGMSRESAKQERKNLNTINPVDDKAGMSRQKYGGNKGDERRSATKDYDGMSRYGQDHGESPAKGLGDTLKKIGRTGTRLLGDIGTQALDMIRPDHGSDDGGRRPPGATSYSDKVGQKRSEMDHYQKSRDLTAQGKTYFNLSSAFDDDGEGSNMFNSGTPKQTSKYGGKGMKRQSYGGNKGDIKRSAKKDY